MTLLRSIALFAALVLPPTANSADNPVIGDWQTKAPRSTKTLSLSFTKDIARFGNEKAEPYRAVQEGSGYLIYIGKEKKPGVFTPRGPDKADFASPNGMTLPLTRVASEDQGQPAQKATSSAQVSAGQATVVGDGPLAMGVKTPFVPMKAILPQLIKAGWTPVANSASEQGYTLLLTAGRSFAVCNLVQAKDEKSDVAFIDCRRLN